MIAGDPRKKYIFDTFISRDDYTDINALEFGPGITESHLGIMRWLLPTDTNVYAIDVLGQFGQTMTVAHRLANKYNFKLEVADYADAISNPDTAVSKYSSFRDNFYDIILAQCSITNRFGVQGWENIFKLLNTIGKKNCKVFFMPWTGESYEFIGDDEHIGLPPTPAGYKEFFSKINYKKYGFKMWELKDEYARKMNSLQRYNILVTKNIEVPRKMLTT